MEIQAAPPRRRSLVLVSDLLLVATILVPLCLLFGVQADDPRLLEVGIVLGIPCLGILALQARRVRMPVALAGLGLYPVGTALAATGAGLNSAAAALAGILAAELGLVLVAVAAARCRRAVPAA